MVIIQNQMYLRKNDYIIDYVIYGTKLISLSLLIMIH